MSSTFLQSVKYSNLGILRWFQARNRFVTNLLKAFKPRPQSLRRLPPEIVLAIIQYLEPESVVSLALTCRSFHHFYLPNPSDLDERSREAALKLIEKDVPHLIFCHCCNVLHQWQICVWYPNELLFVNVHWCGSLEACIPRPLSRTLRYHHARLFMNAQRYGASHGLPLRIIQGKGERRCGLTHTDFQYIRQGRIVDDELYVVIENTIHHPIGNMTKLEMFLRHQGGDFCWHRTIWDKPAGDPTPSYDKPFLDTGGGLDVASIPAFLSEIQHGAVLSCPLCRTDATVEVAWHHGTRMKWSVKVTTWQQLGRCDSPNDISWTSLKDQLLKEEYRASENPPGAIRRRWSQDREPPTNMVEFFVGRQ
ncbi:hypothetical protein C8035_v011714 [Colletotrichum spinosum]|uniref:F-box domain-containing protein n=1 Tax=Colletotrichum spinosum TaxID=1347390 RepID=A0A4R8Q4C2_9PEZI|nr:hypothetical protein C8035_v011714 [Colletotrichum spinosum]